SEVRSATSRRKPVPTCSPLCPKIGLVANPPEGRPARIRQQKTESSPKNRIYPGSSPRANPFPAIGHRTRWTALDEPLFEQVAGDVPGLLPAVHRPVGGSYAGIVTVARSIEE